MTPFEKACEVDNNDGFSSHENVIEFLRNSKIATVTFSQGRYVSKIEKLAKDFPDEVQIVHRNSDSSIVAHIPTRYIRISRPREYTEEERAIMAERLKNNTKWEENNGRTD